MIWHPGLHPSNDLLGDGAIQGGPYLWLQSSEDQEFKVSFDAIVLNSLGYMKPCHDFEHQRVSRWRCVTRWQTTWSKKNTRQPRGCQDRGTGQQGSSSSVPCLWWCLILPFDRKIVVRSQWIKPQQLNYNPELKSGQEGNTTHKHVQTHTHAHIHTCEHTYTLIHTCIHTQSHIHMHMHTFMHSPGYISGNIVNFPLWAQMWLTQLCGFHQLWFQRSLVVWFAHRFAHRSYEPSLDFYYRSPVSHSKKDCKSH